MVRRRASDAGIETAIGCHTFRATGITDYLTNGCRIEVAQRMAGHSNAKTTGLYDRRNDDVSVGKVERIGIYTFARRFSVSGDARLNRYDCRLVHSPAR